MKERSKEEVNELLKELKKTGIEFLEKEYSLQLEIPIINNYRLRKIGGGFVYYTQPHPYPKQIEIAGYVLKYAPLETIDKVLKHELVHYALFKLHYGEHSDGCERFEKELDRLHLPNNYNNNYSPEPFTIMRAGKELTVWPKKKSEYFFDFSN